MNSWMAGQRRVICIGCMGKQFQDISRQAASHIKLVLTLLAVMWLLEIIDQVLLGQFLNNFGIRPRTPIGLLGIVLAPFLHSNLAHLAANSVPFAVLALLILARDPDEFWLVTVIVWLVSGLGVWLFAPANTIHIGASGVIFGYLGFLLFRGFFDRKSLSIIVAIFVGMVYGWVLLGVLPLQAGISWQGHLFGLIGGAIAARVATRWQA